MFEFPVVCVEDSISPSNGKPGIWFSLRGVYGREENAFIWWTETRVIAGVIEVAITVGPGAQFVPIPLKLEEKRGLLLADVDHPDGDNLPAALLFVKAGWYVVATSGDKGRNDRMLSERAAHEAIIKADITQNHLKKINERAKAHFLTKK